MLADECWHSIRTLRAVEKDDVPAAFAEYSALSSYIDSISTELNAATFLRTMAAGTFTSMQKKLDVYVLYPGRKSPADIVTKQTAIRSGTNRMAVQDRLAYLREPFQQGQPSRQECVPRLARIATYFVSPKTVLYRHTLTELLKVHSSPIRRTDHRCAVARATYQPSLPLPLQLRPLNEPLR